MTEHELYRQEKITWSCLLMMKYTHGKPEWQQVRDGIKETLGEEGMAKLRAAWVEAGKEGLV